MIYFDANGHAAVMGSGALRSTEIARALATIQDLAQRFRPDLAAPANAAAARVLQDALRDDPYNEQATTWRLALQAAGYPLTAPATATAAPAVIVDNYDAAQALADAWPMTDPQGQGRGLRDYAARIGLRPDLSDVETRAAVARYIVDLAQAQGLDLAAELRKARGSAGFFDSVKKLVTRPADWGRSVLEEVGKGLQQFGENILNARKIGPLGTYFLDPLAISWHAQLLKQTGRALEAGSISAFDEREFAYTTASTFTAAGTALVSASPFIPQPFGVLASAVGTALIIGGKTLRIGLDSSQAQRDAQRAAEAQAKAAQQAQQAQQEAPDAETVQPVRLANGQQFYVHFLRYPRAGWQPAHFWDGAAWQPLNKAA